MFIRLFGRIIPLIILVITLTLPHSVQAKSINLSDGGINECYGSNARPITYTFYTNSSIRMTFADGAGYWQSPSTVAWYNQSEHNGTGSNCTSWCKYKIEITNSSFKITQNNTVLGNFSGDFSYASCPTYTGSGQLDNLTTSKTGKTWLFESKVFDGFWWTRNEDNSESIYLPNNNTFSDDNTPGQMLVFAGLESGINNFKNDAITQLKTIIPITIIVIITVLLVFKMIHWFMEIASGKKSTLDEGLGKGSFNNTNASEFKPSAKSYSAYMRNPTKYSGFFYSEHEQNRMSPEKYDEIFRPEK